jgi:AcrR family transcriptional regulator
VATAGDGSEENGTEGAPKRERLLRGRTLAERRQERRRALLAAALDLFGTQGYAATPIEEICRHAYVSTRNFYEEFPNRHAVLTALAVQIGEDIARAFLDVEVEPGPDAAVRHVKAGMAAIVHAMVDDPRVARVAFVETMGDDTLRRMVLTTFPRGLQEVLRPTFDEAGLDAGRRQAFTVGLCGAVSELLAHWVLHPDGQPPVDVLVTHVVELTTAVLRLPG